MAHYEMVLVEDEEEDDFLDAKPERLNPDDFTLATDYARRYIPGGTKTMDELHALVVKGGKLSESQARKALSALRADERYARDVKRRMQKPKVVSIPDRIAAGKYAVEVDGGGWVLLSLVRPRLGPMRGGVVVYASTDPYLKEVGCQPPKTSRWSKPVYTGDYSGPLAIVVRLPEECAKNYLEVMKEMK